MTPRAGDPEAAAAVLNVFRHVDRLSLEARQAAILWRDDPVLANAADELRAIAEQLAAIALRLDPRLDASWWSRHYHATAQVIDGHPAADE